MRRSDIQGFYINLDRDVDRRQSMEAGLKRSGLDRFVSRFSARQGDDREKSISSAELGCLLSHKVIIDTCDTKKYTMILEDDVYFPVDSRSYLDLVSDNFMDAEWDVLFLTQMVSYSDLRSVYNLIKKKRELPNIYQPGFSDFSIYDCKGIYASSNAAYIIAPGSAYKISEAIESSLLSGYHKPLDIIFSNAIRDDKIKAKFVFPYVFGINPNFESTIQNKFHALLFNDILNLFVAGGDINYLKRQAHGALESEPIDDDAFIASQIIYRRLTR